MPQQGPRKKEQFRIKYDTPSRDGQKTHKADIVFTSLAKSRTTNGVFYYGYVTLEDGDRVDIDGVPEEAVEQIA